ncbi:MAG: MFS transporter [Sphingomonadales bacterium]|nr:MFS transporter [Sphingomonadales bacterium]
MKVPSDPRRAGMILRGFLCQNVAIGSAFGVFGVALLPMQEKFGIGRAVASLPVALAVLTMGLAAPLVASLVGRIGLRLTMLGGIVLSAMGYLLLALAPSFEFVLIAYALPIGIGLVASGPFASTVLAGNWSRDNPGPAIGLVNMPLMIVLMPLVSVPIIAQGGLSLLYLVLAGLHLVLLLAAWGIVDGPDQEREVHARSAKGAAAMLGQPLFWMMALGSGVLHAIGIIASTHLVAFGIERGVAPTTAAVLISVMGAASVIGAVGSGLLCQRIGGALTLVVIAAGTGLGWLVLLFAPDFGLMAATTIVIGAGGSAVFPAMSVLVGEKFGLDRVPHTLGLLGLATLPFTFGLPPVAGALHDSLGGYDAVLLAVVGACAGATMLYLLVSRWPATGQPLGINTTRRN